jgi:hypothetical protein
MGDEEKIKQALDREIRTEEVTWNEQASVVGQ